MGLEATFQSKFVDYTIIFSRGAQSCLNDFELIQTPNQICGFDV